MLHGIVHNPFRTLGVLANSSLKERMANLNRFSAFQKVGKPIGTLYDFDEVIGEKPVRTQDALDEAQRELNLPIDQFKWSLFWLVSTSSAEDIALKNLNAGNLEKAISILEKFPTWSAVLNCATLSLMKGNLGTAAIYISALSDEYRESLLKGFGLEVLNLSSDKILGIYFEELSNSFSRTEILKAFEGLPSYELIEQKVSKKLTDTLSKLISIAGSCDKDNSESNLRAGKKLMQSAILIINDLKRIGPDSTHEIIADKLAIQVLQNGINYYNNTDDEEAPRIAISLFKFANQTAVGQIAKDRCQDNFDIIKEAFDSLPPVEAKEDILNIKQRLDRFGDNTKSAELSIRLIEECAICLGNLKEKNLLAHPSCVAITTQIIRKALNSVIGAVNKAMEDVKNASSYGRYSQVQATKNVLKSAWDATLMMEKLPIEDEARGWFSKNKTTLKGLLDDAGIHAINITNFVILTEPERFRNCKTKRDFQNYLGLYRFPRYAEIARKRIEEFERIEEEERKRQEEDNRKRQEAERRRKEAEVALCRQIEQCTTLDQLWGLHSKCGTSTTLNALDQKAWKLCHRRKDFKLYLEHLPNGKHKNEAIKNARNLGERVSDFFKKHKGWTIFIGIVLAVLALIGLIWGPEGYQIMLYVIGAIGAFAAWGGLSSALKDGRDVGTDLTILLIGGIVAVACFVGANAMDDYVVAYAEQRKVENLSKQEETVYNRFKNNPSEENFNAYLKDYRHGKFINEVINQYVSVVRDKGPLALNTILSNYPVLAEEAGVKTLISQQSDSLYSIALSIGTRQGWKEYQKSVPTGELRDSEEQIENIDNRDWNTESKAWAKANALGTLAGYYKYTSLYPNGAHYSQANKKIIDLEVDKVMAGEHGELPALDQTGYGYGPTSTISVYNNTSYTLTLYYSGSDSKQISISPHGRKSVTLKNGSYRCVASVDGGGVSNHAGTENLTGGSYEVEYYISTYRTRY